MHVYIYIYMHMYVYMYIYIFIFIYLWICLLLFLEDAHPAIHGKKYIAMSDTWNFHRSDPPARPSDPKGTKVNLLVGQHTSARRIYTAPAVSSCASFTRTSGELIFSGNPIPCNLWVIFISHSESKTSRHLFKYFAWHRQWDRGEIDILMVTIVPTAAPPCNGCWSRAIQQDRMPTHRWRH